MPLFLVLLVLPLIEIALFIVVGNSVGLWPTLSLVVLGALVGVLLLRGQQGRAVRMAQGGLRGVSAGTFLAQGAFTLLAGLLLIMPGFFTDSLGLVLLVPPVQRALLRVIAARVQVRTATYQRDGDIIDGDFEVRDPGSQAGPDGRITGPRRH